MKKIFVSLLLVLSMILSLAACDVFDEKDDPEKNVDSLVSALNSGEGFNEIENKAQEIDVDELLADLKKAVFEFDITADIDGESQSAYGAFKDMVFYNKGTTGDESYTFILDDLTVVEVSSLWGLGYYGTANTTYKDVLSYIKSAADSEDAIDDANLPAAASVVGEILEVVKNADIPDASEADIEYKDGRYYLSCDYIKKVINSYVDLIFNDFGDDFGMSASEVLDAKAVVKGYLDYISAEVYFYVDRENVVGAGASIKLDETFAAEKLGYSDISLSFDTRLDNFAFAMRIANADAVLVDASVSLEATVNGDKTEKVDLDVNAKLSIPSYSFDEDTYEMVQTVQEIALAIDMDADFVTMAKGKGEFITFDASFSSGGQSASVSGKASSSNGGDKISASFSATIDGETMSITANMQNGSASRMPEIPQEVINAKNEALEEQQSLEYWN